MTGSTPSVVVKINADMSLDERRAAVAALARGVRTVEMPASWEIAHGEAVHAADTWPYQGTIAFQARAGGVSAERGPAIRRGGFPGPRNFLKYGSSFSGSFDPATRMIRGTVSSDLKRLNGPYAVGSVFAGVVVGAFFGVGAGQWWVFGVVAVVASLIFLAINIVTSKREAKWLVPDLERIAGLAAGRKPVHRLTYRAPALNE